MTVSIAQLRILRIFRQVCADNKIAAMTLKHRSLSGTESTPTGSPVEILRPRSGTSVLESTTDYTVYVVFRALKQRGGSSDGGDSPAGAAWIARNFGQVCALDVNANPISIADNDWLVLPNGEGLLKIENPISDPSGSYYTFSGVMQR